MFQKKLKTRQAASAWFIVILLALSLLLVACGSRARTIGSSDVSSAPSQQTTTGQQTTNNPQTATPQTSSSSSGNTSQQVQDAVESIDNALNDVTSADATAAAEGDSNEQP